MNDPTNLTGLYGHGEQAFTGDGGKSQKYDIQFNKMKRWTRSVDLFNGKI